MDADDDESLYALRPLHTLMEIAVSHLSGSSLWLSIFSIGADFGRASEPALLWHVFRLPSFLWWEWVVAVCADGA